MLLSFPGAACPCVRRPWPVALAVTADLAGASMPRCRHLVEACQNTLRTPSQQKASRRLPKMLERQHRREREREREREFTRFFEKI